MLKRLFCLFVTAIAAVSGIELNYTIEDEAFQVAFPSKESPQRYDSWNVYWVWPNDTDFEVSYLEETSIYQTHNLYEKVRKAARSNAFSFFLRESRQLLGGPMSHNMSLQNLTFDVRDDCVMITETLPCEIRRYIFTPTTIYHLKVADTTSEDVVYAFLDSFELIQS